MSKIKSNYTSPHISKETAFYYKKAEVHFQNVNKATENFATHADAAKTHAYNVVENGVKTASYIQGVFSDAAQSDYTIVATVAQALVVGVAGLAYYNPLAFAGALGFGAVLRSPADTVKCAKNTLEAGVDVAHMVYDTLAGLEAGAKAVIYEFCDNMYNYDTIELAGSTINTNMIAWHE